jgi:hypothetical protein
VKTGAREDLSVSQRRRQQCEGLSLHSNGNTSCLPESARIETREVTFSM